MVDEGIRTRIWNGLWEAKSLFRYYQVVRYHYELWNKWTLILLAFFGTGSLATIFEQVPYWAQPLFGLMVFGITIWVMLADYSSKAAVAHAIAGRCGELAEQWDDLFLDVDGYRIDELEARGRLVQLNRDLRQTTAESGVAKIRPNKALTRRCFLDTREELSHAVRKKGKYDPSQAATSSAATAATASATADTGT